MKKSESKEVISSLLALDEVKIEKFENGLSPFVKFTSFIAYYSDFDRLIRSLCYVFRVVRASLIKEYKERKRFLQLSISPLTVKERLEAEIFVIKIVQKESFGELYDHIRSLNGEVCVKVGKKFENSF